MSRVCPVAELADGTSQQASVEGHPILLCRSGEEIFAIDDTCPHEDVSLSLGAFSEHTVRCPLHGSRFCVRTGKVLDPPADQDIATHRVEVIDDWVVVTLTR